MPAISLDTTYALELAEFLLFVADRLAADPARLPPSLLASVGRPAYGLAARRAPQSSAA
ncbi:hypothetical protein GCM10022224_094090 [Nonomuraea antimicrobica]|uniref:Uncharacterized protein n=1 Tax=Nonomuraea antimicrobica TaxID=561173 RepID=A0ABP7E3Q2_9ACTN